MSKAKTGVMSQNLAAIPTRVRPREFDRAETLNKVMEVFWEKGYMQTTPGDLCAAMGITAPSFYCAFKTRKDLFLEVIDHYARIYRDEAVGRFLAEKDIYAGMEILLKDAVKIYSRHGKPRGCFTDISSVGLSPKKSRIVNALESSLEKTRKLFRKCLVQAIDEAQLPPEYDIPAITDSLITFIRGIVVTARGNICQS